MRSTTSRLDVTWDPLSGTPNNIYRYELMFRDLDMQRIEVKSTPQSPSPQHPKPLPPATKCARELILRKLEMKEIIQVKPGRGFGHSKRSKSRIATI